MAKDLEPFLSRRNATDSIICLMRLQGSEHSDCNDEFLPPHEERNNRPRSEKISKVVWLSKSNAMEIVESMCFKDVCGEKYR